ncbi:arginine decarboxylase [Sphingomonas sp. SORGH_AS802]|uniref:aminotransferase class I/II-fold pyridoxal phosphate-dependent enzyme n=1 Tax=unclassified Sphingomonas TaxID=196159 RepID=UPI002854D7D5|nr:MULTISPECIES: aminotransferase class V-fold PLP-dependent enzyme [unclassified Sphingomonas]MDR6126356.1 arginine decarboxylase [Sphingomonas sp. SORGH_AS_0438]MDR6135799.1 arginine decarboxylase [Sphingomonas sp. SORGH_AS_0802]
MDQKSAPLVEALAAIERKPLIGFGAPGHNQGAVIPSGLRSLLGRRTFRADVLTPKGLDDRTEGTLALQRAHEIAAEAWNADFCRFVTGGSTQSLHTVMAAVAGPGDTILVAANAHKAERTYALAAGLDIGIVPVQVDQGWDIEHGVTPDALRESLAHHPAAKAFVLVSPTYYGVTSDVAALATLCHEHGIPLIVDAAWGGAFAFCEALPDDPLTKGADAAVYSAHKTMGALAQGSIIVAKGDLLDRQRLWMAYELFETTSPSVPILASLDATRRDHALRGEQMWNDVLALADHARETIAAIAPLRVLGRDDVPAGADLDRTKILIDVSALGVSGYAIDDWLYAEHRISIGLSDARHLLAVIALGTTRGDIRALEHGLADLVARLAADPAMLPPLATTPGIETLSVEMAMAGPDAIAAPVEMVRYEDAGGRIAAEMIAPAPPGVPRLVPGQRISPAHVAWLVAQRDAGAFIMDPVDPTDATIRVVA